MKLPNHLVEWAQCLILTWNNFLFQDKTKMLMVLRRADKPLHCMQIKVIREIRVDTQWLLRSLTMENMAP